MSNVRILLLGDIVGQLGRAMVLKHLKPIREKYRINGVIVNGENCTGDGRGITSRNVHFFKHMGVDIITSGNHIWAKREVYQYLTEHKDLLRPANFPSGCPGTGVTTFTTAEGLVIGVLNIQGRVFMAQHIDCPFRSADSALTFLRTKTKLIFVDFHAETTSEKAGMGIYLDGRISGMVGTHTHVQTADERILPKGTAFITDLGMAGARNSMIGMKPEPILANMLTAMPHKFEVDNNAPAILCGVVIEADPTTGKAISIERIQIIDNDIRVSGEED